MVIMKASTKLETPSLLISSRPHVRGLHLYVEDILTWEIQDSVIFTSLEMSYVQVRERGMMMGSRRNSKYRFDLIAVILDLYITTGKFIYLSQLKFISTNYRLFQ